MNKIVSSILFVSLILFSVQCTHAPSSSNNKQISSASQIRVLATNDWIDGLAASGSGNGDQYYSEIERRVAKNRSQGKSPDTRSKEMASRIAKYVAFVMHNYEGVKLATKTKQQVEKELITRIFESSTQFIMCPDLSDFECLEKTPEIPPSQDHRQEDPSLGLGKKKTLNAEFGKSVEWHFTDQLFKPASEVDTTDTLAADLEKEIKKIKDKNKDAIYMSLYGIDDIQGSMKGVYTALLDVIEKGIPVKGVFDNDGMSLKIKQDPPLIFSYVEPKGKDKANWVFAPIEGNRDLKDGAKLTGVDHTNMEFKYDHGTQGLIMALAKNATKDEEAMGRLEWKNINIMHNKYFVFKKGDAMSVWTGTANVSKTCMGMDRNSNMGVLIKNNEIAKAYLDEFNEMFEFQTPTPVNKDKKFKGLKGNDFPYGRFHMAKRPNTHRYFHFSKDGTDVRVYFSPTDDAEHRAILPMIHSARPGDTLLLSMFGAGGMELVRALYWAAAIGVNVEVIADNPTARGVNQFLGKAGESTLFNPNPYDSKAKAIFLGNNNEKVGGGSWGQNHQKIGLLIRKNGKAEQLIFGSQNWSGSGNDVSDENLIALRDEDGLEIGEAFKENFYLLKEHATRSVISQEDAPASEE